MGRRKIITFLYGLLFFLFSVNLKAETRILLVGIEEYSHHNSHINDLKGCLNDLNDFKTALKTVYGFSPEDFTSLINESATKSGILNKINASKKTLKAGDHFIFYFAGHGSQVKNSLSPEDDHLDECILPYDAYRGPEFYIRDKEVKRSLNNLIEAGIKVSAIFDACHSGSITRGNLKQISTRFTPAPNDYDAKEADNSTPLIKKGAVILSAAQDNQTAKEFTDAHGYTHGAFTFALVKSIYESSPNTSISALFQKAHAKLAYLGLDQEPVLSGDPLRLFNNILDEPVKAYESKQVVFEKFLDNGELVFEGGSLQGLAPHSILEKDGIEAEVKEITAPSLCKAVLKSNSEIKNLLPGDFFTIKESGMYEIDPLFVFIDPTLNKLNQNQAKEITEFAHDHFDSILTSLNKTAPVIYFSSETENFILETETQKIKLYPANWKEELLKLKENEIILLFGYDQTLLETTKNSIKKHPNWELTQSPDQANFQLVFFSGEKISAKLINIRKSFFKANKSLLPAESESIYLENNKVTGRLGLSKIARLHYWYNLENPADELPFVYDLVLTPIEDTNMVYGGKVLEGNQYGLALKANIRDLTNTYASGSLLDPMYIYVFTIDKDGLTQLLYPLYGNLDNHYPLEKSGLIKNKIQLGQQPLFKISPPFGKDSFFMLCTYQAIPDPGIFNQSRIQYRAEEKHLTVDEILASTGYRSKNKGAYKIKKITFESIPKSKP